MSLCRNVLVAHADFNFKKQKGMNLKSLKKLKCLILMVLLSQCDGGVLLVNMQELIAVGYINVFKGFISSFLTN